MSVILMKKASSRIGGNDFLRVVAILVMATFHLIFDLTAYWVKHVENGCCKSIRIVPPAGWVFLFSGVMQRKDVFISNPYKFFRGSS